MAVVIGTPVSEVLDGSGDDDIITGVGGNDTINAFAGNDTLDGGSGADSLIGGAGDDVYWVDNEGDRVSETYGEGHDTIYASVSYALTGRVIERLELTGLANINALGNSQVNYLVGNAGNNWLDGAGGADTLQGGLGDDTYVIDAQGDVIVEENNAGTDTVMVNRHYTLSGNFENLTLTGSNNLNGTGSDGNNVLTGNSGNNVLTGGLGDDTYYIQNTGDIVTELHLQGNDTIYSTVSYSLFGRAVETLVLWGANALTATGNSLDNVLTGNEFANWLDGAGGNDTLTGGAGNDTYAVNAAGDVVVEAASGGTDDVHASVTYSLGANVEYLHLTGTANIDGNGNIGVNQIWGNSGNNVINGGGSADQMWGGAGDDTYYVDDIGDKVYENHLQGTDTVNASVTYSFFGRAAEILNLTGTGNISGTGNSLVNTITGNVGNNTLDGAGGNDWLAGGLGSDVFLFQTGSGQDTITDFSGIENDSINIHAYANGNVIEAWVVQSDANVVINLGGGNWVKVEDATRADVLSHIVW